MESFAETLIIFPPPILLTPSLLSAILSDFRWLVPLGKLARQLATWIAAELLIRRMHFWFSDILWDFRWTGRVGASNHISMLTR